MDSFIYALVLVPALRELLPRSGIPAATANLALYGGLLFALFLIGWGLSLLINTSPFKPCPTALEGQSSAGSSFANGMTSGRQRNRRSQKTHI
jgi:hypothetical protein